jgi:hypothetical protein
MRNGFDLEKESDMKTDIEVNKKVLIFDNGWRVFYSTKGLERCNVFMEYGEKMWGGEYIFNMKLLKEKSNSYQNHLKDRSLSKDEEKYEEWEKEERYREVEVRKIVDKLKRLGVHCSYVGEVCQKLTE